MSTPNDFWSNPTHKLVADMLQKQQAATAAQQVAPDYPWYRVIYTKASDLLAKTGLRPDDNSQQDWPEARAALLDIWAAGLSLAIQQFGLSLEDPRFETLVETVTRRIEIAQGVKLPGDNVLQQVELGVDGLVAAAACQRFSYDDFFALAHALDRDELIVLHRAFMSRRQAAKEQALTA
jgi:hypothetical protein